MQKKKQKKKMKKKTKKGGYIIADNIRIPHHPPQKTRQTSSHIGFFDNLYILSLWYIFVSYGINIRRKTKNNIYQYEVVGIVKQGNNHGNSRGGC